MKICWDNIEHAKLTKQGLFRINHVTYYYIENCSNCYNPFLRESSNKNGLFCSKSCAASNKNHSFYGKHHSKETRAKISKSLSGENNPNYGKCRSESTKVKISKANKGKYRSENTKEKLRQINLGKKLSNETRRKIGKTNKKNWENKEYKEKFSGENCSSWKGGYSLKNIPTYDTYARQINWCEDVRKNKIDSNILDIKCAYCGKWFTPTLKEIQDRIQALKGNYNGERRIYCSNSCKFECPIYNKVKWPKGFKVSTSREVQAELRQMVLERDNYECQKCGSTESLHCHHLEGIRWEPLQSADIDKCITLCKKCHTKAHKLLDCGTNDMKCPA